MKKSDFFEVVKSMNSKNLEILSHNESVSCFSVWIGDINRGACEGQIKLCSCKTEENAAKEMHKFNRWLSESLETIHPSETQWMPEEEKLTSVASEAAKIELCEGQLESEVVGLCGKSLGHRDLRPNFSINPMITTSDEQCEKQKLTKENITNKEHEKLQPGLHQAKVKAVGIVADKVVYTMDVGGQVISMNSKIHEVKKEKSPAKMFIRATMNILKQYDCFDSAKNSHWSSMTKKQKKDWARKFGIEMMECQAESYAMDLASDYKNDPISNILMSDNFNLSDIEFYLKHKDYWLKEGMSQLIAEMDYSSVEEYIEENLNCLW